MPLTTIDPTPALVVVDLQAGVAPLAPAEVVANNVALVEMFRDKGFPVVLVNVTAGAPGRTDQNPAGGGSRIPAEATVLLPDLGRGDIEVSKTTWGAFASTDLHRQLQARGVTQLFVTGVATSIGVESTAREAHAHGYHVVLVPDAMADRDPVNHEHAVTRLFPRMGQVADTDEVLSRLS